MICPSSPFVGQLIRLLPVFLAVLITGGWGMRAAADSTNDLLFFTSVDTFNNLSDSNESVDDSFVRPTVDVLYSFSGEHFRFLAEYLWSSTEADLERMKAGWQVGDNSMLWLGRFHATAKHWTTEYHHGQFLQTSITRPSVEEWEDESGPMPSHVTGLSIEHESLPASGKVFDYGFSVGLAPMFFDDQLEPFDILDPGSDHGLSVNLRFASRPKATSINQVGLLVGWNEINVESESNVALNDLEKINQLTVGIFGDWRWERWRLIANAVYFDNDMRYFDGPVSDQFLSAYVQGEFLAAEDWTLFGRVESSFNEDESPYLRLLSAYISHRHMLGIRWDFVSFQSLSMEIADTSAQGVEDSHDNFKEIRFQWSAVFP